MQRRMPEEGPSWSPEQREQVLPRPEGGDNALSGRGMLLEAENRRWRVVSAVTPAWQSWKELLAWAGKPEELPLEATAENSADTPVNQRTSA